VNTARSNPPAFYERLLDAISPAVIALDHKGAILHWNRCAGELFGIASEEVTGMPFQSFVIDNNASLTLFERILLQQSTTGEIDVRTAHAAEIRLLVHAASIYGEQGHVEGIVLQAEHVGERQRGEIEQRLLAEVGAILSNSLEGEAVLDRVSRLLVPRVADSCVFYRVAEDGSADAIASAFNGEELASTLRQLETVRLDLGGPPLITEVLRDGSTRLFLSSPEELRALARTDAELELLQRANFSSGIAVAMRARGRTIGALGLGRINEGRFDHRDVRLVEEIARRAAVHVDNQALYETAVLANKSKSDFLAVISHELRTPLTTIMGYVELMTSGVPEKLPPKSTAFLERVRTAAWHLLGLIEQILIYARLEAGRENLMPETISVSQLLNDVRGLVEPNAIEKGLAFVIDPIAADLTLVSDLTKVRQILINVASNAVKFTESGEVHLGARRDGADMCMYVRDTGIGISAEHSERIFDAFWQVDQSDTRRVGGAGLGLSVSRRLARLLGGDMSLTSVPGSTEFVVRLPRAWRPREELAVTT
jgi:PAS domain S-box-containing protein